MIASKEATSPKAICSSTLVNEEATWQIPLSNSA